MMTNINLRKLSAKLVTFMRDLYKKIVWDLVDFLFFACHQSDKIPFVSDKPSHKPKKSSPFVWDKICRVGFAHRYLNPKHKKPLPTGMA